MRFAYTKPRSAITPQAQWQRIRREAGLCITCAKPRGKLAQWGRGATSTRCAKCAAKQRLRYQRKDAA